MFFAQVCHSASSKEIKHNLRPRPAEGSQGYRGLFMVLYWYMRVTSPIAIVAKVAFTVSQGPKHRNGYEIEIVILYSYLEKAQISFIQIAFDI